jgi:hypothetical protein
VAWVFLLKFQEAELYSEAGAEGEAGRVECQLKLMIYTPMQVTHFLPLSSVKMPA